MLSIPFVWEVYSSRKKMFTEAHKLKGLLRFKEVSGQILYASIHPSNNVIENLGHHFIQRLPTQNFMIHDKNRNLIFLYNTKDYNIVSDENFTIPSIPEEEKVYQNLGKQLFETFGI